MKPVLKVYRETHDAILPKYSTESSACFDIHAYLPFAPKSLLLRLESRVLVPTGLIFDIPSGYSLRLHPRSGLALKQGITLVNAEGVVDEDYTQPVSVILLNTSKEDVVINHGDRICQAELVLDTRCTIEEIQSQPKIKTNRTGGFGSTGK